MSGSFNYLNQPDLATWRLVTTSNGQAINTLFGDPPTMRHRLSTLVMQSALPGMLVCALAFPADIFSQPAQQDHIVSPQALQQQLEASSAMRQRNLETLNNFLSSPVAEQAMQEAHIDPVQVKTAVPTLTDQELASLASRAADAQMKFSAGVFSNHDLLVLAVAVLVIILVIVAVR